MTPLSLCIFIESLCHPRTRTGQEKTASLTHSSQCQLHLLHSFVTIGGNGGEHTGCFYKEPYSTHMHLCSQRELSSLTPKWREIGPGPSTGPEQLWEADEHTSGSGHAMERYHPHLKGRRETACYIQLFHFSKLCQLDNLGKEVTEVSNPTSAPLHRRLSVFVLFLFWMIVCFFLVFYAA